MGEGESTEVTERAVTIIDQARAVKVTDAASYTMAGELWKAIRDMMKEVADTFDPIITAAHAAHKKALEKKAQFYAPLEQAQKSVKQLMSRYDEAQAEIARQEAARLAEIARKAEEERRRIELEQLAAERKASEDAALAAAVELEKLGDMNAVDEALLFAEEQQAAAKQEAAAVAAETIYVAPITVEKSTPKLAGGPVYSTRWDFEIMDVNKIPRAYMIPDLVKIRQVVTALKAQTNIDGIKAFSKRV